MGHLIHPSTLVQPGPLGEGDCWLPALLWSKQTCLLVSIQALCPLAPASAPGALSTPPLPSTTAPSYKWGHQGSESQLKRRGPVCWTLKQQSWMKHPFPWMPECEPQSQLSRVLLGAVSSAASSKCLLAEPLRQPAQREFRGGGRQDHMALVLVMASGAQL